MKKFTSIKTRITMWYTGLMLVLIAIVLTLVGALSYQLSIDNVEKNVTLRVTQISEKMSKRQRDVFRSVENREEFKNVSIYTSDGQYIAGEYIYDAANIKFREGRARRESVDGKEYIVYDVLTHTAPGEHTGFWIRGAESVNSTVLLGRSAVVVTLVIIPIILLLTAFGGYYITGKAFVPINEIIKTANKIAAENDIKQRIRTESEAKPDEIYELSVTLNRMLDKIESLILQEKQFTSDASHELRTPISVILAESEYLLDIVQNDKERELAQNIVDKARQMSKLVTRLLLLARIDRNSQKINKERINLGAVADIAVDMMRKEAEEKGTELFVTVDENVIAEADEALIISAVTNLIANAIKYGKESGYVGVAVSRTELGTEITVSDNGSGISAEHIDKIWDRFYRVDDVRNDNDAGYGLGLALVKSIVELHGGTVFVRSNPGEGTQFGIILK